MHIPPLYRRKDWQRLMVGFFLGGVIAYLIFIYMYGQLIEKRIEENLRLRTEYQELQLAYDTLESNLSELNQKYQQKLLINSIDIIIVNADTFKLDRFILHELEDMIKEEVKDILGKEAATLNDHYPLLIRMIENKSYTIDGFTYQAKVNHLFINENSEIHIELDLQR
ncbi:sporulation membrane protein YtrI [Amphibacillus sediminis]|uniref:sporulation membrane protein YtrI n=1 Tax=Amphibacillus sediminis TaxID=360185 RepID=UPI00082A5477|nr:sporulation membrane protein YtrI [Amphibacillus sediminis]